MFQYHPDIVTQFPHIRGGVLLATSMTNQPTSDDLKSLYMQEQEAIKAEIGNTPLSELPSLAAWRRAFSAFGVSPTKYRSATEALLRRLTKKGDIPSINTLVDIGNLISIRYKIPVAVFDTQQLTGKLTVHFAQGNERYTELGSDDVIHPDTGEVVFSDETGLVFARRWCWKQSKQSAAQITTINAIICTEAQHENNATDIEHALNDMRELFQKYAGGEYQSAILDKDNNAFPD